MLFRRFRSKAWTPLVTKLVVTDGSIEGAVRRAVFKNFDLDHNNFHFGRLNKNKLYHNGIVVVGINMNCERIRHKLSLFDADDRFWRKKDREYEYMWHGVLDEACDHKYSKTMVSLVIKSYVQSEVTVDYQWNRDNMTPHSTALSSGVPVIDKGQGDLTHEVRFISDKEPVTMRVAGQRFWSWGNYLCHAISCVSAVTNMKLTKISTDEEEMDTHGGVSFRRHIETQERYWFEEHCFASMCLVSQSGRVPVLFSAAFSTPQGSRDDKEAHGKIVVEIFV